VINAVPVRRLYDDSAKACESVVTCFQHIKACKSATLGRLAQLGEHQLDKLGVTGSSPVPPIPRCRNDNVF
jgi:hypothetical protein